MSDNTTEKDGASKATHPFWLDGGYDFESVIECPHHPSHHWWTFRLGDVLQHSRDPDERLTICAGCFVPRCGTTADGPDRCMMWRHHESEHVYESGGREPVGGIKAW